LELPNLKKGEVLVWHTAIGFNFVYTYMLASH